MSFWVAMLDRRRESLALNYLQEIANYEVYLPRVRDGRNGHHRVVPLFPSYLFVRESPRGWWQVRWSPGMMKVIMTGDAPALLSDQIVNELKSREDRTGLIRLPKRKSLNGGTAQFAPGDQVRIKSGPMSGFVGLVEGMRGPARVELLLQMLGRVELAASAVARV
jgi:transcriptional antiterminator RfaH